MDESTTEREKTRADGGPGVEKSADEWNSARVYAVCGAITGGAFGIAWGPPGVLGLAVLGAMVGHDWAQHTLED